MNHLLRTKRFSLATGVVLAAVLFAVMASAQLGGAAGILIPYAGQLDLDGAPVDSAAPVSFRFTLWNAASGGTPCPDSYLASSPVHGGRFQVEIGPVAEACVLGQPVFLAVEVDNGGGFVALSGRQRVYPALGALTSGPGDFVVASVLRVVSDTFFQGRLRVSVDEDVGLNQAGSVIIGPPNGVNMGLDGNEIMARNNGAASTLFLNSQGGTVQVGGPLNADSTMTIGSGTPTTKILHGVAGNCASGNLANPQTVSFGQTFSSVPRVFLQPTELDNNGCISARVTALSTTGFDIQGWSGAVLAPCGCMPWLAIGP
jgi:hypothetical protein